MKLREFKSLQLIKLRELEQKLLNKYTDKQERIQYLINIIKNKLTTLSMHKLYDYLRTLDLASREFREFEELIPTYEILSKIIEEGEEE